MSEDVAETVATIIAEQAMVDSDAIKPDTTVEDLGLDSLALVEVVFGIEEAFDISVPFNANNPSESDFDITSVQSILEGIERLKAEQG